jgi:uncharacterized protein YcfJ
MNMNKFLLTAAMVVMTTPAFAESVKDVYKTVINSTPQNVEVCSNVKVPVYGNTSSGASGGDVLSGMIIGGLLGKGITGKDNGAAAGAIFGGIIAADKKHNQQSIVGHRIERQCSIETRYSEQKIQVYSHSVVTFNHEGRKYQVSFEK